MTAPGIGMKSRRSLAKERYARQGMSIEEVARSMGEEPQTIRDWIHPPRKPLNRTPSKPRRQSISPASKAQREKVRFAPSIVSGQEGCDPAHLTPKTHGGCAHPDCVVALTREEHRAFDLKQLDLLPNLTQRHVAELQHALGHYHGDLISLLERVTGERWKPVREVEAA